MLARSGHVRDTPPRRRPFDRRLTGLPAVRWSLAGSVALGLVSAAGIVAQAVGLAHILASAMPDAKPTDRLRWFAVLGCGFSARSLAALAGELIAAAGASAAKADLRAKLVAASVRDPALRPAGGRPGPGTVATLAGRGLDALDVYLGRCLPDFVLAAAAPAALLGAAGVLDWPSALIMAFLLALFPIFGTLVGHASLALGAERWRRVEALGEHVADLFLGLPVLRAFGRSKAQRARIAKLDEALRESSAKALRVAFLSALVLDTLGAVSVALVAAPLGLRLLGAGVKLSAALAVLAISPEVFAPLRRASAEFHESTEGLAALNRVFAVIKASCAAEGTAPRPASRRKTNEPAGQSTAFPPVPDPREVAVGLEEVSVIVPGRTAPVLAGADLVIEPGETVALVGASGSGKSTVVSLLAGFLEPTSGRVTAGGHDLRNVDLRAWRSFLTYLPEHPTLLPASLAGNLRLARPHATDDELLAALEDAGAPDLVASLPLGLATPLGEGGRSLSAGERQRVALARTLLRPASLYLLDEPTVHMDQASEEKTLASLQWATSGASVLIISHRPLPAHFADRLMTLRDGKILPVASRDLVGADV